MTDKKKLDLLVTLVSVRFPIQLHMDMLLRKIKKQTTLVMSNKYSAES